MTLVQINICTVENFRRVARLAGSLRWVLIPALLMTGWAKSSAAIIQANDCSVEAVKAACATASPGDTVQVPAGTAVWTSPLLLTKDIQLLGAGSDKTMIVDEITRNGQNANLIYWATVANGLCRLSGFTFQGGVTNSVIAVNGTIAVGGFCSAFRLDSCSFQNLRNQAIFIQDAVFGVVDHCRFYNTNFANDIEVENGKIGGDNGGGIGYGDVSWATPVLWGQTNDFMVIEDCTFTLRYNPPFFLGGVDDMARGSRVVFRFNTATNCFFQDHGTESSGRIRSGRAFEIYGNTFVRNDSYIGLGSPFNFRGGTGVVFSNIFSGYGSLWSLQNFRATDRFVFGSANGQNPWDANNPDPVATGAHTGSNGSYYLEDTNQNWTPQQFIGGYELQNISLGGTNTGCFSLIASNSATRIYYLRPITGPALMLWTNGQTYKIYYTQHQIDQVGSGSGDLLTDTSFGSMIPINSTTGQASWPHQSIEPLYQWANTWNGKPNYAAGPNLGFADYGPNSGGLYNNIVLGRDFINNTPKPNYTPLVYPHPLVTSTGSTGDGGTGGGGTGGGGPVIVLPPTGLQAIPH